MPDFVIYLIAGALGAYSISIFRWLGEKYMKGFPDIPLMLGRVIDWGKPEPKKVARVMGSGLHLATGALWGLIFGVLVQNSILFSKFGIMEGILFAILPWLFFLVVLLPLAKGGLFGLKIDKYHWLWAIPMHIVFGMVLGGLLQVFA